MGRAMGMLDNCVRQGRNVCFCCIPRPEAVSHLNGLLGAAGSMSCLPGNASA